MARFPYTYIYKFLVRIKTIISWKNVFHTNVPKETIIEIMAYVAFIVVNQTEITKKIFLKKTNRHLSEDIQIQLRQEYLKEQ